MHPVIKKFVEMGAFNPDLYNPEKHCEMLMASKRPHLGLPVDYQTERDLVARRECIIARIRMPYWVQSLRLELHRLSNLLYLYEKYPLDPNQIPKEDSITKDEILLLMAPLKSRIANWVVEECQKEARINQLKKFGVRLRYEVGYEWKMCIYLLRSSL